MKKQATITKEKYQELETFYGKKNGYWLEHFRKMAYPQTSLRSDKYEKEIASCMSQSLGEQRPDVEASAADLQDFMTHGILNQADFESFVISPKTIKEHARDYKLNKSNL